MEHSQIGVETAAILQSSPGRTARELVELLRGRGIAVSKSDLNYLLYRDPRFDSDGATPPRWSLAVAKAETAASAASILSVLRPAGAAPHGALRLYGWQADALAAWKAQGRRGVVEAVTGTGKTVLGIAAAIEALASHQKVCVLVPTIELLEQWVGKLQAALPRGAQVGRLGGGYKQSLAAYDVLVAVVNSARAYDIEAPEGAGLLVADECHRYGSDVNNQALDERFAWRLGLSATYARSDDGHLAWLEPYFGSPCFEMDYRLALAEEVTAHFKVALIGCRFSVTEASEYDELSSKASKAKKRLVHEYGVREEPFGEFMKEVSALAEGGGPDHDAVWTARKYLHAFQRRRQLIAETPAKMDALDKVADAIRAADRTIIFTQTIDAAEAVAEHLQSDEISAATIHSQMHRDDRHAALEQFRLGSLDAIVAPQVLDEGVDVPEADLAVIVAASRNRRQMIQRMGRVLRRKPDDRLARFAVLYVEDTSEDPALGAHEAFLEEITSVADARRDFSATATASQVCSFLNRITPAHSPRPPRWKGESPRL